MVEENGNYYIRPIKTVENSSLVCEMEIQKMEDVAWEDASEAIRNQMCE